MANNIILGTDLMLFKAGKALAAATSCKLTIQANTLETSSKDSGKWTTKQAAKLSWNCSSDNLFTVANYKELADALIARQEVEIRFSTVKNPDSNTGVPEGGWVANDDGYKGMAIITQLDLTASDNENATYTVSLEGSGALTAIAAAAAGSDGGAVSTSEVGGGSNSESSDPL